jgi:hypothetical protein
VSGTAASIDDLVNDDRMISIRSLANPIINHRSRDHRINEASVSVSAASAPTAPGDINRLSLRPMTRHERTTEVDK